MGRVGEKKEKKIIILQLAFKSTLRSKCTYEYWIEAHEVVTSDWILKIDSSSYKAGSVLWLACKKANMIKDVDRCDPCLACIRAWNFVRPDGTTALIEYK